ncbi:coiled-coil-helix-coiled-coil-helix domain-containing protein 1-like [Hydractinia symbiolongicarpus]|uniref:coiled-coil-helix-coiled-coil-helix domain-containing protein 1-like n=1 Tax=Hydractinia symbiolongicarpus TaxID=13093 RepID=UPI00255039C3|nr:coiled-coil-helix-coiled-coil-helix domain-containing protein 1-like [Hydractinia symbiolongicarpus]
MVNITEHILAKRQSIIYGVKRGKIPTALRPRVLPQRREAGKPTCLDQMSKLFNCWNSTSFDDKACDNEIKSFLLCANESLENYHKSGKGKKTEWNTEKLNELVAKYTVVNKRGMREKQVFLNQIIK